LDAIRETKIKTRFYQASTSEMFGGIPGTQPQSEKTPFHPRSPYGAAKLYAHWITVNYREAYNLFACSGILFNHESPRRGRTFVTRKISVGAAKIKLGLSDKITLGNLDARRDWGFAPDYVRAMHMMLQAKEPDDYVIATGQAHSVREFCEKAFLEAGMEIVWKGKDIDEKGIDKKSGKTVIEIDPRYFRPSEVEYLLGDPSKAVSKLGWKPQVCFEELVGMMVREDIKLLERR
jgi:GDPmannose 4,6-dehydratase